MDRLLLVLLPSLAVSALSLPINLKGTASKSSMARTMQTARKSTGGLAPRKQLSSKATNEPPVSTKAANEPQVRRHPRLLWLYRAMPDDTPSLCLLSGIESSKKDKVLIKMPNSEHSFDLGTIGTSVEDVKKTLERTVGTARHSLVLVDATGQHLSDSTSITKSCELICIVDDLEAISVSGATGYAAPTNGVYKATGELHNSKPTFVQIQDPNWMFVYCCGRQHVAQASHKGIDGCLTREEKRLWDKQNSFRVRWLAAQVPAEYKPPRRAKMYPKPSTSAGQQEEQREVLACTTAWSGGVSAVLEQVHPCLMSISPSAMDLLTGRWLKSCLDMILDAIFEDLARGNGPPK